MGLSSAQAGVITFGTFAGDTDPVITTSINTATTYTALADFNSTNGARIINGVTFNTGTSGTGYALTGANSTFNSFANSATGNIKSLLSDFNYQTANNSVETLMLTGLTPGTPYVLTLYNAGFGTAGGRNTLITPSGDVGAVAFTFDENASGQGNPNFLRYAYTPTGTTETLTFVPNTNTAAVGINDPTVVNTTTIGDSFHQYGFTNAVVPEPASLGAMGLAGFGLLMRRRKA